MGLYINPNGMTKEAWLDEHAVEVSSPHEALRLANLDGRDVPVFLVDNGPFTAAAIAYNKGEWTRLTNALKWDTRPVRVFLAPREALAALPGIGHKTLTWRPGR